MWINLVMDMIEEPRNVFEQIKQDPNFIMILAGAIIWYLGYYIGILGGLFLSTGFVLVCFSAALNAIRRAIDIAWPGLLIGGLIQVVGYYLAWIPFLGDALVVIGGVAIMYFAIPLAIQRGELPILTQIQKVIEAQKKSAKKEEGVDSSSGESSVEEETTEFSSENDKESESKTT